MRVKYGYFTRALVSLITLSVSLTFAVRAEAQVMTGLDNLLRHDWSELRGKRVGLITNQTGRTRTGEFGPHLFAATNALKLVALYSPEHGLMGERQAGVTSDTQEEFEGVPVYSLYGSTRKPTKAMLSGVNALVFDIQDVGVRPYTYVSTMILAMEAAAEHAIPFFVLDRPNPLSGNRVEGNILDTSLKSFVGEVPVPYLHGMTLGELAKMARAKGWFHNADKLKLTVIPMSGWKRSMYWDATRLTWTPPSPNVPTFASAVGLAMFGATGELGVLSVGVGTDKPFLRIGSTLLTSGEILRMAQSALPGQLKLASDDFASTTSAGTKTYHGVRIDLPYGDLSSIPSLYDGQYRLLDSMLTDTNFRTAFDEIPASNNTMYQKVTGMYGLMDSLKRCRDLTPLFAEWQTESEAFRREREPYLLYK